jgi:uroporphyrinogen decarboxylase
MLARVERLPKPDPDVSRLLTALRRGKPSRIPMLEIKLDEEIQAALLGEPLITWSATASPDHRRAAIRQHVGLMHRLGYDAFRIRTPIPFTSSKAVAEDTADLNRGQRAWQDEHTGPVQTREDFDRYAWPTQADVDYSQAEEFARELPDGMSCIGYVSGVFEWASWLMGLEPFMLALYEQPELVRDLCDRVGRIICDAIVPYGQMDHVAAVWVGDDLGFKTSTLISPAHLREYVLPWHRRFAEVAHRAGKPYLLHSCGNIGQIMDDLADDVKIDAKHSFEEVIEPVERFYARWREKVTTIGGVDVDLLARGTEAQVHQRALAILQACAPGGAYVAGSGNSVTNYIPVDNYLAMVEALHEYNGRM